MHRVSQDDYTKPEELVGIDSSTYRKKSIFKLKLIKISLLVHPLGQKTSRNPGGFKSILYCQYRPKSIFVCYF